MLNFDAEGVAALVRYVVNTQTDYDSDTGRKIAAIRQLRELWSAAGSHLGLKDAKDLVEATNAPPVDPVVAVARAIANKEAV
jgi:ribosomal protein L7/L12